MLLELGNPARRFVAIDHGGVNVSCILGGIVNNNLLTVKKFGEAESDADCIGDVGEAA